MLLTATPRNMVKLRFKPWNFLCATFSSYGNYDRRGGSPVIQIGGYETTQDLAPPTGWFKHVETL